MLIIMNTFSYPESTRHSLHRTTLLLGSLGSRHCLHMIETRVIISYTEWKPNGHTLVTIVLIYANKGLALKSALRPDNLVLTNIPSGSGGG